jgi:hypothetical protein
MVMVNANAIQATYAGQKERSGPPFDLIASSCSWQKRHLWNSTLHVEGFCKSFKSSSTSSTYRTLGHAETFSIRSTEHVNFVP